MIILGVALWLSGLVHAAAPAQSKHDTILCLLDKKIDVFQNGGIGVDVFFTLCHDLAIPCGEERFSGELLIWPPLGMSHRRETMSLREALDLIVKRQPQYKWEVTQGVLVLFPRNADKHGPLEKPIAHFSADSDVLTGVTNRVIDLMGVQHVMGSGSMMTQESTRRLNFDLKNTTPREILNTAVHSEGHAFWRFTYLSKSEQKSILNHPSVDLQSYAYR